MSSGFVRHTLLAVAAATATFAVAATSVAAEDGHTQRGEPCWTTSGTINGVFHSRELGCIPNGAPAPPKPSQATDTPVVQGQDIPVVQSDAVQPDSPIKAQDVGPDFFFHTYALNVPGAVWTSDDWANWVQTTYVAPGVPNTGGIVISPDGTYTWNNTWEDRVIQGTWIPSTRDGYTIQLQAAEGDRDWFVGRDPFSQDGTEVILWGGQSLADQYRGRPAD